MKRVIYFITILVFMINTGCAQSQNENEQIISMLREFYIAYNNVWANATNYTPEEFEDTVFSLQQKYCSERLQGEIKKYYETYKLEHDLLTNDFGGTDPETLKSTLTIIKDTTKENSYVVSYTVKIKAPSTPREEKNVINLTVVKEKGSYKIDQVL
ncbi:MAG TPA: hypothetical protein VK982_02880 [Bacteroidales bacterium]|nr:hypothetical protein [Bacteroidales bacterium]